jgi:hypothetical protein
MEPAFYRREHDRYLARSPARHPGTAMEAAFIGGSTMSLHSAYSLTGGPQWSPPFIGGSTALTIWVL